MESKKIPYTFTTFDQELCEEIRKNYAEANFVFITGGDLIQQAERSIANRVFNYDPDCVQRCVAEIKNSPL